MKKRIVIFISILLVISTILTILIIKNNKNNLSKTSSKVLEQNEEISTYNDEINVNDVSKEEKVGKKDDSKEFMEKYFEEIKNINSDEEKENMLIIISSSKIGNTYGAQKIIEAPNNQYILQYESTEKKDEALIALKEDDSISSVEENIIYTIEDTDYNSWGVEKMALDHAIDSSKIEILSNVTVAIIDSGCNMNLFNQNYSGKIVETYNVLENSTTSMVDENGHGTHIAGTIAEATTSNVKILPVKVSRTGSMYNTDVVAAINYITEYNKADVINMSFGSYYKSEAIEQAIDSANNKNIICVAAAGNDNTNKKHYPSSLDNTISIASVDSELKKSSFSNYGSDITFAAPGTNILSINGKKSGTSMATPHAVSAIAILKGYNKDLTLENTINVLKLTALDLGEEGWDEQYGYGLISFKDVQFREDNINADEYNIYKKLNSDSIINIELTELKFTPYNYYSITNLMASKITVYYADNPNEEMALWQLPHLEVLNYSPTEENEQTITIKTGDISIDIDITNPNNYESGWEYSWINQFEIKITGYKNHGLNIGKLYIPEKIDSKNVKAFEDNLKFSELGNDFLYYDYLYLPSNFNRIGDYSLSNTNIKYVYGDSQEVEIGNHGFESSSIVIVDVPIIEVGDYAFKDCFELINIDIPGKFAYTSASNTKIAKTSIGNYAFYDCKKLAQIKQSKQYDTVYAQKIGDYAFYNCISLYKLGIKPNSYVGDYAFYSCFSLITIDLYQVDSIGIYSFYGSGISEAKLGLIDEVKESSFENCKNLKAVSFTSGNIENRAFYNSGVELITIGSKVNYIAEDAFAYCPIKNCYGGSTSGKYYCMSYDGIIESAKNKLIVGFSKPKYETTQLPDGLVEIGNYAFTGNNTLENIIIPESVIKIGEYAFKDCYQLTNVYMLGQTIEFSEETFKRTYEGEINNSDLVIYVHKNAPIKQYIIDKSINYRQIEPDEIEVTNYQISYKSFEMVDFNSLEVKLIYHESEDREEILSTMNWGLRTVLNNSIGVGFVVDYQTSGSFRYGDTYFKVRVRNKIGYEVIKNIDVQVDKATPTYTIPTNLTANKGQKLSEITLPNHFEWMNGDEIIEEVGNVTFKARYIPSDTQNYETIENIDVVVNVTGPEDPEKPTSIHVEGEYTYNGIEQTANIIGFDSETMNISGNKQINAGTYNIEITSKTGKWADGTSNSITIPWEIKKAEQSIRFKETYLKKNISNTEFTNELIKNKGNGEISYNSSNNGIAEIDSNGKVKIKTVGQVTITATIFETQNYKESTASYTLIINQTTIDESCIQIEYNSTTYNGKNKQPKINIIINNLLLSKDMDFKVEYKNNKNIGTASIILTGIGNYNGKITKTFKINPKGTSLSNLTAGKKKFTAKWKKQATQTTGYQIQYSTDKNFKKNSKTSTISKNKALSKVVSKLKSKKKYYVRIRTYKTVNGKKYYSDWSKSKTVKTK